MPYRPTYSTRGWDPFAEMRALQREMNRVFNGYESAGETPRFPNLNLWSNGDEAIVTAEIPGVDASAMDITVIKNHLTVQGERTFPPPAEGVVCHRAERGQGRFVRTLRLPFEVESDSVKATYEKGVLTITLPRSEASKPNKIAIEAA